MRITSKGQVTIPQAIREQAGMMPNTEVEFEYRDTGEVVIRRVGERRSAIRDAIERTKGSADEPMFKGWTTDQIMAFLRGDDD
jgi:AbrB family looped-hinge helix DNA binding protein